MTASDIFYATIVRFGEVKYEEEGIFIPFEDVIHKLIIIEDDMYAVSISDQKIYPFILNRDGHIPEEELSEIEPGKYYAYDIVRVQFNIDPKAFVMMAENANAWYHDRYVNGNKKVIDLNKVKKIGSKIGKK